MERFCRLAPEKQRVIRKAAFEEFARIPFDKVSINRIIRNADISRGSFYTYFEDKQDLLLCILEDVIGQARAFIEQEIKDSKGDIFHVLDQFFRVAVRGCRKEDWFSFSNNVMGCMDPEETLNRVGISGQKESESIQSFLFKYADLHEFASKTEEDFKLFMELAVAAMMVSMRKLYNGVPYEKVQNDFRKKLEILRHGVCQ